MRSSKFGIGSAAVVLHCIARDSTSLSMHFQPRPRNSESMERVVLPCCWGLQTSNPRCRAPASKHWTSTGSNWGWAMRCRSASNSIKTQTQSWEGPKVPVVLPATDLVNALKECAEQMGWDERNFPKDMTQ